MMRMNGSIPTSLLDYISFAEDVHLMISVITCIYNAYTIFSMQYACILDLLAVRQRLLISELLYSDVYG